MNILGSDNSYRNYEAVMNLNIKLFNFYKYFESQSLWFILYFIVEDIDKQRLGE